MGMKATKVNDKRIGLSLNLVQNTKQRNQGKNTNHKTQNHKHEVCKTKVQTYIYYNEIKKCKHDKNRSKLWC